MKILKALVITKLQDVQGITWVNRARGGRRVGTRPLLENLHISGNIVVATDGRRLHRYEAMETYPSCLYQVVQITKKKVVLMESENLERYPNFEVLTDVPPNVLKIPGHTYEAIAVIRGACYANRPDPNARAFYNTDFLMDSLDGMVEPEARYHQQSPGVLHLISRRHHAIIMPMR